MVRHLKALTSRAHTTIVVLLAVSTLIVSAMVVRSAPESTGVGYTVASRAIPVSGWQAGRTTGNLDLTSTPAVQTARPVNLVHPIRARKAVLNNDRVFAHYFPPYPISLDNEPPSQDYYTRNYLSVNGEGGKHRAYGGLLRDRPIGRTPLPGDWRLTDMRTEIRQAKSAGIDGFTLDILELSGRTYDIAQTLMRAADVEGDFAIIPMLDASSLRDASAAQVAPAFAKLLMHPSADTIGGEHVLSAFLAENKSVTWWKDVIGRLTNEFGIPVKFIAVLLNPSPANMRSFATFSYGLGSWGTRNAAAALTGSNLAAEAHALGVKWMQAVAVQDARPRVGAYAEAGNTETLRATWGRAIADKADFVQIATWNDYSESTSIAPSVKHGSAFLALCGYYSSWFANGVRPLVGRDHLILTHRKHPWQARATSGINNMVPTLGGSQVKPRNTVEALLFLIAPATVTVQSGHHTTTVSRPAGLTRVLVPLHAGRQRATIRRGPRVVKTVTSPFTVVRNPYVEHLDYVAAGS